MAFTLAHPAAVLSIVKKDRKYYNNAALIIGAMAPDFEYFIFFKPKSSIGHKLIGCLTLNLALVFLTYFLFYKFIKDPLIKHLPNKISKKLEELYADKINLTHPKDYIVFILSALLGMFTHIIWDGFTHNGGFFVNIFSVLNNKIFGIYIYKLLQHGSTLLGITMIVLYIKNLKNREIPKVSLSSKIKYWVYIFMLALLILVSTFLLIESLTIGVLVVSIMNSVFLAILIISVFWSSRDDDLHFGKRKCRKIK